MTAITGYSLVRTGAAHREQSSVRAIEKINTRAGFDGEHTSRREPPTWICTPTPKRETSQTGTDQSDPYWDAPRLKPTFVAQVMGQVYCTQAPLPSAGAAYRATPALHPTVLDENI